MMTLKTLFLHPLGPSLILALGGFLLLPLTRRRVSTRPGPAAAAHWTVLLAFLVLAIAGTVLIRLRATAAGPLTLQWAWQPLTVAGSALSWRLDGWNWLAALLVLCMCAAVLALLAVALAEDGLAGRAGSDLAGSDRVGSVREGKLAVRTLWLGAAAAAFVCSDNLVTLAGCWVALDAALALRLLPGTRAQPAARAWGGLSLGGLLVLAALIFQGEANANAALSGAASLSGAAPGSGAFAQPVLALLWLAALLRAGAYPLHLWLFGADALSAPDRVALHLIGPAAGIWLLARLESAGPAWLHRPEWAALGALALIGTAIAAWTATDAAGAWRWIAVNRASLVVLTAYVAAAGGPPALALSLVAFALGAGLLALGQSIRAHWGWGLPAWLGVLALWGLPGTPGFLARSALALPAAAGGAWQLAAGPMFFGPMLFGLIVVAETLLVAALWHAAGGATRPVAEARPLQAEEQDAGQHVRAMQRPAVALAAEAQHDVPLDSGEPASAQTLETPAVLAAVEGAGPGALVTAGTPALLPAGVALAESSVPPANGEFRYAGSAGAAAAPAGDPGAPAGPVAAEAPGIDGASTRRSGPIAGSNHTNGTNGVSGSSLPPLAQPPGWWPPVARPAANGHGRPGSPRAAARGARLAPASLAAGSALLPLAVVTILLAVPLIAWGLWPHQLAVLAGLPSGSLPATLGQVLAGTRRSVWIGLVFAGFFGCLLGWHRARIFHGIRGWQEAALAVVRLEWAYQAAAFALGLAGSGLRYFARLGEGEGYIGWLALAALVLWVLLRS